MYILHVLLDIFAILFFFFCLHGFAAGILLLNLTKALGIVEDVSTGWTNVSTEWFQNPAHSPCFFVTSGCNSCREMFTPKCGPVGDSSAAAAITANENDNVNNKLNNNNNDDRDAKEKNVDKKITSADSNNNNVGIESMHSRLPSSWHDTEGGTSASTVQQRYTADLARLVRYCNINIHSLSL